MFRRHFLQLAGGAAAAGKFPRMLYSQAGEPRTYVYKKAGGLEIKADVFRPSDESRRPIVVWIHGGALIMGSRRGLGGPIRKLLLESGYVVVSIDYRLAPESKLPAIIEDVEDSFRWIRGEGAKLFHGDPSKLAVAGGSAGGYLTLVTGYRVLGSASCMVCLWWFV
jgi:acetyl esterase/lipase